MSLPFTNNSTLQEIVTTVKQLSPEEQKRILLRIRSGELTSTAKRLSKTVKKNTHTISQTIDAVKKWKKTV